MKISIEPIALQFKNNPYDPFLQKYICNHIITKFTAFIGKQSYTYANFEPNDVDSIITDVFCRIQKNIGKWDETTCKFTTWLYSCIVNEIRAYFASKEKFYSKFLTETKLSGGGTNEEGTEMSDSIDTAYSGALDKKTDVGYREKTKIKKVKDGILGVRLIKEEGKKPYYIFVLYNSDNEEIGTERWVSGFKNSVGLVLMKKHTTLYDTLDYGDVIKIRKRYNVKYFEEVAGYREENDDLELAKLVVKNVMNKKLNATQKQFMKDYFSANYTYNELMEKYEIPLSSVKNWVHNSKQIIKQTLNKYNLHDEEIFQSC